MSQDGSAGRDLIQVGRDYIRHINVNIASGNWLMAGVSLLPAIVTLGVVGTGVKFTVEHVLSPISSSSPPVISSDPIGKASDSKEVKPPSKKSESEDKVHDPKLGSNKDIFHATPIALGKTVFDSKINAEDQDFFSFVTSPTYRDVIQVRIENSSTTLRPSLNVYDAEKRNISGLTQP